MSDHGGGDHGSAHSSDAGIDVGAAIFVAYSMEQAAKNPKPGDPRAPAEPPPIPDQGSNREALIVMLVSIAIVIAGLFIIGAFGRG
jgi:hypothetical protein